ncbi:Cytosol aminopeptidase, catalytic domain [Globomyces sp. JEL0801]|nr:Cytosol aminopeptidase, catalytic domain [Globomyces sp. JEL0801]
MNSLISISSSLNADCDALVVIASDLKTLSSISALNSSVCSTVLNYLELDQSASSNVSLIISSDVPGKRLILSPTGSLNTDVDDVRRFSEAARAALNKCKAIGVKHPMVVIQKPVFEGRYKSKFENDYKQYMHVSLLGLLYECYEPLQVREHYELIGKKVQFEKLSIYSSANDLKATQTAVDWVMAVESGRIVARGKHQFLTLDIGFSDPERMAPLRCAEYIQQAFKNIPNVKVTVIREHDVLKKEFPLLHAVARLEYNSPDQSKVKENLFFVGKGVTYDTGGADIKFDGHMRGMSRDKCGAAMVAGFLKTVGLLKPEGLNVVADLGFVRNSSGAGNYVSDEIIKSRAGVMGERAISPFYSSIPSRLFTVCTLTGHAVLTVGVGYTISLDNGPAKFDNVSSSLATSGNQFGDPWEQSTYRREDLEVVKGLTTSEDVYQANNKASSQTPRGHMFPAAFLILASGLDKHGMDSEFPISFTHVDMAASGEEDAKGFGIGRPTGSPIVAFSAHYLQN